MLCHVMLDYVKATICWKCKMYSFHLTPWNPWKNSLRKLVHGHINTKYRSFNFSSKISLFAWQNPEADSSISSHYYSYRDSGTVTNQPKASLFTKTKWPDLTLFSYRASTNISIGKALDYSNLVDIFKLWITKSFLNMGGVIERNRSLQVCLNCFHGRKMIKINV